jgi:hypothetical protein
VTVTIKQVEITILALKLARASGLLWLVARTAALLRKMGPRTQVSTTDAQEVHAFAAQPQGTLGVQL